MKTLKKIILNIFFVLFSLSIFAQNENELFELSNLKNEYHLNAHLQVLTLEENESKSLEEIQRSTNFRLYKTSKTDSLKLESNKIHWGKITIQNALSEINIIRDWKLFIGNANFIEVYVPNPSGTYQIEKAGNLEPASNKTLDYANRQKRVPFNLSGKTPQTIFIKITGQNHNPTVFDLRLCQEDFHQSWSFFKKTRLDWLFLGFLVTMLIFNLLLYFGTRDLAFFYHFMFLFGVNVYLFEFYGIMEDAYFFSEHPFYIQQSTYIMLMLMDVGYIMFVREYMHLNKLLPKWDKILKGLVIARVALCVGTIILFQIIKYEPLTDQVSAIYMISEYLFLMFFMIILYRTKDRKAWFLVVGTALIMLGVVLSAWGILSGGSIQGLFVKIGLFGEILFFSLGLAYRMKILIKEEQEAHRLKDLNDFKARFYTNITHEFRTPLTVIKGMSDELVAGSSQLAVSKNVKEELSEKLGLIKRNGDRLLNLVNRILDLAKLESGSLALNLKNGNIISYLNYLVHSFHSYAQSKDIHIKFLTELDHLDMDYDEEKIQQIITNLLSNAIKFTPEGGQIKVLLKHLKDSNQLYISVKDSGIGIGKEDLTHVFERFYQTKEITKRANEGSGIGLSLVNELIELMSGKIKAKSEIGKGTEFELWLPIDNQQSPIDNSQPTVLVDNQELNSNLGNTGLQTKSIDNSKSPFKERTKATLLIIEDSPDIIQYLKTILQNDYEILTAFNGAMGIETAIENVPDIIISDVMMPEKDGFEVCEALKNDERTSHIPIILLTAKATVKDKIAGLTRGADAYLAKPFEKEELFIRLEKLVDLRKKLKIRYSNFHKEEVLNISTKPDPFIHTEMEDAFLLKLKKLMEDNLNDSDFGIPQICRGMAMSRAQLHRKITALTGKSTSIFIRSLRLHHAKKLLLTTDLNISEVAYDVGFKDPNYFSRTYAEEFGETPSETRN